MQLRVARLCLDCEEIHAEQQCPVCASEAFTFIKRWVPAPERRSTPRGGASADADVYKRLTTPEQKPASASQLVTRAAVGLAAASVAGWLWRWTSRADDHAKSLARKPSPDPDVEPASPDARVS
jgi:hypothetical protein